MEEQQPDLGSLIRTFRATVVARLVIAACGVVIVLLGALCFMIGFTVEIGLLPIFLGICVLALSYFLGRQSCLVYAGGVVSVRFGQRQSARWDDVREIVDTRITQGLVSSRVCTLVKTKGSPIVLRDLGIGDFGALIALFREQAKARGIPWKEESGAR